MESENIEVNSIEMPKVFLEKIVFNDGTELSLTHNSVVVFTGANNSGKSQVLKDIELCLDGANNSSTIVVDKIKCDYCGEIDEEFLKDRFQPNQQGNFQLNETGTVFSKPVLQDVWQRRTFYNGFYRLFVKRLDTLTRITSSDDLVRNNQPEKHPIYKLNKSDTLAITLSEYFRQAFGVDLVVNRNEMKTIPLHVGQAPDKTFFTMDKQDDYYKEVSALPKLQNQGDGMRSFASILLDTFTSEYSITLIDEPEAFLHPPQARTLGKMLAKNNPNNRQLLISTHSEDFLQGLLDADNDNVTVIRINRIGNINKMSILTNEEIKKLWGNPLLRYSNILSGLFHEKVVVCESDYDCLFYQAIMDAMYESRGEVAPDILFTHCGGKSRAKDVVKALKAVDVPIVAVCDFDLLNSSQNFKPLVAAFGLEWKSILEADMKIIYDSMNSKKDAWNDIKKIGKIGFTGNAPAAYETVESICKSIGLFIVPVGEMECFDKTVNKEKKEWVYHILENYELATETKLKKARNFVQEIIDFKPATKY